MRYNNLTKEERVVIEGRGTEAPFSGEYDDHFEEGVYLCRRCDTALYRSETKFNADCGWPSFDDEIEGAVKRIEDGSRTEIICSGCGAHLGHVFTGEGMTPKGVRHCVNSLSLRFVPLKFKEGEVREVVLGGGCFWCLDATYRMIKGVDNVVSGYAGGNKVDSSYDDVLSGKTGHAEVVKITYDHEKVTFEDLLKVFFAIHDPTTLNRQGSDVGEQYRSIIFYRTWEQKEEAEALIEEIADNFNDPIVTEIRPLNVFYPAEGYHQNYYEKNPDKAYCRMVVAPKLKTLTDDFRRLVG